MKTIPPFPDFGQEVGDVDAFGSLRKIPPLPPRSSGPTRLHVYREIEDLVRSNWEELVNNPEACEWRRGLKEEGDR